MNDLKNILSSSIEQIITKSLSDKKILEIAAKHKAKIHFIPKRYRILGGILQSMNIQFGNFIESVMANILRINQNLEIVNEYSGKKSNFFSLSEKSESMIDSYILMCQTANFTEKDLSENFSKLIAHICDNESTPNIQCNTFQHDVDILFYNKLDNMLYFTEVKYNDDHDTGKFVDINRKFLKTYAYLIREFKVSKNDMRLKPLLFYFNNKKMKGNIYIPENECIYRGQRFFQTFTTIDYLALDQYMTALSERDETVALFDSLYKRIINKK